MAAKKASIFNGDTSHINVYHLQEIISSESIPSLLAPRRLGRFAGGKSVPQRKFHTDDPSQ